MTLLRVTVLPGVQKAGGDPGVMKVGHYYYYIILFYTLPICTVAIGGLKIFGREIKFIGVCLQNNKRQPIITHFRVHSLYQLEITRK